MDNLEKLTVSFNIAAQGFKNAFFSACRENDLDSLDRILTIFKQHKSDLSSCGITLDSKDPNTMTGLMIASNEGHAKVVKKLLAAGADHATKTKHGETADMFAKRGNHSDIVELLEEAEYTAAIKELRTKIQLNKVLNKILS